MSNAPAVRIANAVVVEINNAVAAEAFDTLGFTAARSYGDWDLDFKDAKDLQVDVVFAPNEEKDSGLDSFSTFENDVTINIVFRKWFQPGDRSGSTGRLNNEAVDPLVKLIDDVRKYFVGKRNTGVLASETNVSWSGDSQVRRWYDHEKLRRGMFEGYVQLRFVESEDSP